MKNKLYLTHTQIKFLIDFVLEHWKPIPSYEFGKIRVKTILYKLTKELKPYSRTVYRKKIDEVTITKTYKRK